MYWYDITGMGNVKRRNAFRINRLGGTTPMVLGVRWYGVLSYPQVMLLIVKELLKRDLRGGLFNILLYISL
jgi:hypothetical protein